ncbi:hypothetical protein T484DRAFT_1763806 [Baffinella frigidus]|nr:hypothetical protein T484DRAFT_1763806 [Cryptophyta sp. CCMP2293]
MRDSTQAGWIKYVEYLNSIVSDWLLEHLTQTLAFFLDQVRDALSSTDNNLSSTQMTRVPSQKPRQLTHTHSLSATLRARPLPRAPSAAMDGEGAGLMGGVKTERAPLLETRLQITNNEMVYFPTIWPQSHKQTTKRLMKEESLGVSQESYEKTNIAFLNRGHSIASDVSICGSVLAWLQSIIHFLRIASHPSAPLLHQATPTRTEARNASQVAPAPDVEVDLHFAVNPP